MGFKQERKELKHKVQVYEQVIKSCRLVSSEKDVNLIRKMSEEEKNLFQEAFDLHPDKDADMHQIHKLFAHLADEMINRLVDEQGEKKDELEVLEKMKIFIQKEKTRSWKHVEFSSDQKAERVLGELSEENLHDIQHKLQEETEFPVLQRLEVKQILKEATGQEIKNDVVNKIIDKFSIKPDKCSDIKPG